MIAQIIADARGPMAPDEILREAQLKLPQIGIATVYRTVKLLLEADEIHAVTLPDGQARYEAAGLEHHHHFRCRECNRAFDLPGCAMHIKDGAKLPGGFKVEHHEVTLIGLCPECA